MWIDFHPNHRKIIRLATLRVKTLSNTGLHKSNAPANPEPPALESPNPSMRHAAR
jgi:hypothetical protein